MLKIEIAYPSKFIKHNGIDYEINYSSSKDGKPWRYDKLQATTTKGVFYYMYKPTKMIF